MHPSVEGRSPLLATAAWLESNGIGGPLDGVAQPDFFFDQESRKSNAMRLALRRFIMIWRSFLLVHDAELLS
jgi:hypothetical protein